MHDVNINNDNAKDTDLWGSIKKFCNEFYNRYYKYIIVGYDIDTVDKDGNSKSKRVDSAFEKGYKKTVHHVYEEIRTLFESPLKKNMTRIGQYVKIIKNILRRALKAIPFLKNIAILFYIKYIIAALEYNEIFLIENNDNYKSNTISYALLCFGKFMLEFFVHCSLAIGCFNFYFFIVPFPPHGAYILIRFLTLIHLEDHYDTFKMFAIFGWAHVVYGIFVSLLVRLGSLTDSSITQEWSSLRKDSLYKFAEIIMTGLVVLYIIQPLVYTMYSMPVIYTFIQSLYSYAIWLIGDSACLGCFIILQGTSEYYFNIIATIIAGIIVEPFKIIFSMLSDIPPTNIVTSILAGVIDIADAIIRVVLFLLFGRNYSGLKDNTKESGLEILYDMLVSIIRMMERIFAWSQGHNPHHPSGETVPVSAGSISRDSSTSTLNSLVDDNTNNRMPAIKNASPNLS